MTFQIFLFKAQICPWPGSLLSHFICFCLQAKHTTHKPTRKNHLFRAEVPFYNQLCTVRYRWIGKDSKIRLNFNTRNNKHRQNRLKENFYYFTNLPLCTSSVAWLPQTKYRTCFCTEKNVHYKLTYNGSLRAVVV